MTPLPMWTLEDALHTLRDLEAWAKGRFHVALAGGVLLRGSSEHDLDLWLYPHRAWHGDVKGVHALLQGLGWTLLRSVEDVQRGWTEKDQYTGDTKVMEVWVDHSGRRVDVHLPYVVM